MKRSFLIPSVSAMSLVLTSGCYPIMGEWELTDVEGLDSLSYSYTYNGITLSAQFEGKLTIDSRDGKSFEGELEFTYSLSIQGGGYNYTYDETESFDVEMEKKEKRIYEINVDELDVDYNECALSDDNSELVCEDEDSNDWTFEKVE